MKECERHGIDRVRITISAYDHKRAALHKLGRIGKNASPWLVVNLKTINARLPFSLVGAEQLTGKDGGERAYNLALLSRVTLVGGTTLPFEDLLDLDAEDIAALLAVNLGFTESQPKPS